MLESLSPARRRLALGLLGGLVLVLVAVVALVAVRVVAGRAGSGVDQAVPGPVIVVPGYGGDVSSLAPVAARLRADGRQVVVFRPTDGGTGDLRVQAQRLGVLASRTVSATGADSVDVVGYSAGGVVARLWVRDDGGDQVARRVLTIGSPHHGTDVAAIAQEVAGSCPTACEQLAPDSDLLRRLNAGDETPDGPQWATVRSSSDQVVSPTSSAALSGATDVLVQDLCPAARTTHGELPGDPVTLAMLGSSLGVADPAAPARVSC